MDVVVLTDPLGHALCQVRSCGPRRQGGDGGRECGDASSGSRVEAGSLLTLHLGLRWLRLAR